MRTDTPDSVHRARVAVRKIRSALRVFAADEPAAADLDDRLREWGNTLGRARDAEVIRESLRTRVNELLSDDGAPCGLACLADQLDQRLGEEHERARTTAVDLLDTPGHTALLADLERFIASPAVGAPDPEDVRSSRHTTPSDRLACDEARFLIAAARSARMQFRKRERQAAQQARADVEAAWHRARRAARRARYASDLASDAVASTPGRTPRDHAKRRHQDTVTLRSWLENERSRAQAAGEDLTPYDSLLTRTTTSA